MYDYENQCGGCLYYDYVGENEKGYCSWHKIYCWPGDTCTYQKPRQSSAGCYITTIVCDILGLDDKCEVLETLRGFRKYHLQASEENRNLLLEYDYVGPEIAGLIKKEYEEDKDRKIWESIYNTYLVRTSNYINSGDYKEATKTYIYMVKRLKEYFAIPEHSIEMEDYDFKNGGHGYILKKREI